MAREYTAPEQLCTRAIIHPVLKTKAKRKPVTLGDVVKAASREGLEIDLTIERVKAVGHNLNTAVRLVYAAYERAAGERPTAVDVKRMVASLDRRFKMVSMKRINAAMDTVVPLTPSPMARAAADALLRPSTELVALEAAIKRNGEVTTQLIAVVANLVEVVTVLLEERSTR